ncbi:branched-chain amino acid aminotransferase/4-amino-4-deoxychorismate lyase [Schinkia azotoformans MEV2011]|uniref:Branched-chain-amino-acid aminotransferase n=1 Tax=Schinkia azotoformans MEV2011 TaxID=1348973 RepID=A0A072NFV2_SCHAZ|nr:branched-chain amino acid aminotransferase [Schinkia azotoformans]KEF35803.1 branched-chain amino acid aminotransferase/4-amino-4-deoxychorismate lyase [Schinkia azotoformans MEV2011]MEC1698315.1 branched-chain amino acid aminotransferase [Schinkia azotoformans]MEC1727181.1 branched-chain amino acid aminotransferase [Schinkia azotoformans]MEC1778260.1 branched-chain amino acid aminotransferase [Schinkia azotoformans]MED4328411.1 branched-chain amino acid aminotransferase [Schinkia azotoform
MLDQTIKVDLSSTKKPKPDADKLQFGKLFTDHMFIMNYKEGQGWHDPRIVPYQPLKLDPSCVVFHYGQTVFEGMKAYVTKDGEVQLFRPNKNFERLNRSNDRLVIPQIDEEFALEALKKLVSIDKDWVPTAEGTSLYIRPFIIATQPYLGVAPSSEYMFIIIMSPVGAYYKEGLNPVKIQVEDEYVRTVKGGTGEAKTGGNYAASLKAQEISGEKGYSQVLWLDGKEHKYVEEVGSMNMFFKVDGKVITPALNGSILQGITRDSIIQLLKHWNVPVEERRISIEEIYEAAANGKLEEAFGTGTAAVISPVGELLWKNEKVVLNEGKTGEISKKLYDTLTGIQYGTEPDPFGWTVKVE